MIIKAAKKLENINEYYFSMKLKQIAEMRAAGKPVINLGIGNPDQPPSSESILALKNSADNAKNHGYQSYVGVPTLRKAMSDFYLKTYDVLLNPNNEILPLLGSKEGISHISHAFLNPNDKVLVPNPGYPTYVSATYLAGAIPVFYDLDEANSWLPNFDNISDEILNAAKICWINYPNMPTGASGSREGFEKLIELAKKHKFLIVNDNPYSLILNEEKPVSILQVVGSKDVCIELNSLSKSHNLAGARIGMVCGRADYLNTILKVKSNVDSGTYLPIQDLAIAALSNTDEWHKERNEVYRNRRAFAYQILDELGCVYETNQVGMFIWAKIANSWKNSGELADKILEEANVFITPGMIFGSNGERFLRISLCSPETDLQESLERVKATRRQSDTETR
jgi:LL-diaminopimelate aminotransferase